MKWKLSLFLIVYLSITSLAEDGKKKLFCVSEGTPLELITIQKLAQDTLHHMNGFATIMVSFNNQTNQKQVLFDKNLPHAGEPLFFEYLLQTIQSWKYNNQDAKPVTSLFYTINSDGTIKVFFYKPGVEAKQNSMTFLNSEYDSSSVGNLILHKGFEPQNIISPIIVFKTGFGGFIDKLGRIYAIIFAVMIIVLIVFCGYVWINSNRKITPTKIPEFYTLIEKLWTNSLLYVIEQYDIDDSESKIELTLDIFSDNIDHETSIVKKIQHLLNTDEIKNRIASLNLGIYAPDVKLDKLYEQIKRVDKELNNPTVSKTEKKKIIYTVNSFVWKYYTEPFLEVARDICIKNREFRAAKILLAGIENHLHSRFHWFSSNEINRAISKNAQSELASMNWGMDWIWTISGLSPMVGLFGTVTGITRSFDAISKASAGLEQTSVITSLAGGINEALYTTIVGLILGISSIIIYYFFKTQLDEHSVQWEIITNEITKRF